MARIPISQFKEITPKQVVAQWRDLPHKFNVNLWNFEIKVGDEAKSIFQESFDLKKFNSKDGAAWKPRSKLSKATHPLMVETGSLKNSITWKHIGTEESPQGVLIYTDPNAFNFTKRHQGFCFAAVHNGPDSFRRGKVRNMPRRKFIGGSTVLRDKLIELSETIFNGFPK